MGLDPPHRVILAADPENLHLIELLRHGAATGPLTPAQTRLVRELCAAGLLVDGPGQPPVLGTVAVHDLGLGAATAQLGRLLEAAGVGHRPTTAPDLLVACSLAPLPRAVIDPWLAEGTPHLVVCGTGRPGSLRVGPFVVPGLTACLRCIDAAEATDDPRRPLVVEQLAVRPAAPVEAVTLTLALAWAARDITAWLRRQVPSTWSATVDLDDVTPALRRWPRHPECGCCWDELPY